MTAAADSAPSRPSALSMRGVTLAYDRGPVLQDVDLDVPAGSLTAVIGPNGSGKTTLLRAAIGLMRPLQGEIRLLGGALEAVRRDVAFVPQRSSVDWDFPVRVIDVVMMGRLPRLGWWRRPSRADREAVGRAMDRLGIAALAHRQIGRLSGGQQQRVFLARALAQEARLYLMDEPLAAIDAATEEVVLELLRDLRNEGRTVIAVHHALETVRASFDHAVLLAGRVIAAGSVEQVLTREHLMRAYGQRLIFLRDPAPDIAGKAADAACAAEGTCVFAERRP